MKTPARLPVANPLRRLAAFGLDYILIAIYLVVLAVASLLISNSPAGRSYGALWTHPGSAEISGFLLLTLPVILYFAIMEASSGATLGKRRLGLKVVALTGGPLSPIRAGVRSIVKFLPWELAHASIWQFILASRGQVPWWSGVVLALVYLLAFLWLITLFADKTHRTIYDRVAGSLVTDTRTVRVQTFYSVEP